MTKQTIVNMGIVFVLVITNTASIFTQQIDTTDMVPPLVISEV